MDVLVTDEEQPLTAEEQANDDLGCDESSIDAVPFEGSFGVANVTAGDTTYRDDVAAQQGNILRFQLYLHNLSPTRDVENLRARLVPDNSGGEQLTHLVELQACGSNTTLSRDIVVVRSDSQQLVLGFDEGTVKIRAGDLDGRTFDRGGFDDVFRARGESLGRLRAEVEPPGGDLTVAVSAEVQAAGGN